MNFYRRAASLVAVGGVAALGIALVGSGGVGAAFTDSATASASIDVGTFSCQLSAAPDSGITIVSAHRAEVDFGTIQSSAAGSKTATLTVTNEGSIPLTTHWSVQASGALFDSGSGAIAAEPAAPDALLAAGDTQDVAIGFTWDELGNADLGKSGKLVYSVDCADGAGPLRFVPYPGSEGSGSLTSNGASLTGPVQMFIDGVASTLPTDAPAFTATGGNPDSIYFRIELANGDAYSGNAGEWWSMPGGNIVDWADIANSPVSSVSIAAAGSDSYTVSCLFYDGTSYLGSGTCS